MPTYQRRRAKPILHVLKSRKELILPSYRAELELEINVIYVKG